MTNTDIMLQVSDYMIRSGWITPKTIFQTVTNDPDLYDAAALLQEVMAGEIDNGTGVIEDRTPDRLIVLRYTDTPCIFKALGSWVPMAELSRRMCDGEAVDVTIYERDAAAAPIPVFQGVNRMWPDG